MATVKILASNVPAMIHMIQYQKVTSFSGAQKNAMIIRLLIAAEAPNKNASDPTQNPTTCMIALTSTPTDK